MNEHGPVAFGKTFFDFLRRVRYWLLYAPADKRRERARRLAKHTCRTLGLYPLASWSLRRVRRLNRGLVRFTDKPPTGPQSEASLSPMPDEDRPGVYDVICLPVILWDSRFQRPQQLMRQCAEGGHRVFYASLGFHGGVEAELSRVRPRVYEMTLPGTPGASVYQELPSDDDVTRMAEAVDRLRRQRRITSAVVVVQLPFWNALAERLREMFGWPIVYDCMDDHSGFSTNCDTMLQAEDRTITEADLVVVTSDVLHERVRGKARRTALVRNACDYDHFADGGRPSAEKDRKTMSSHPTIGFYGAIAEWFDSDLVADLAELRPEWKFELIGNTFTGDVSRLKKLPNVSLLGEKPYQDLPRLVADWDCFIIPFQRIPLTEATNPVKAYEMLATGKPVVAVDLPELRPMADDGLLSLADDAGGFAAAISRALADDSDKEIERRREFAACNTWENRCTALDRAVRKLFPPASIIIVTFNNLALNQGCLQSIFGKTDWPNFEVLVVDNASSDGTAQWLLQEAAHEPRLRVILNTDNRGFSAANNQGLRAAHGEHLCLLNNDTVVTRGWLSTLIGHLRKTPELGMIGPVSNMVGNEAKIPVGYAEIAKMPPWAAAHCRQHDGETVPIIMLGFFCVVLCREVYEKVGELDEQFGTGYFEDTDYCCRVRRQGYELRYALDAFVHHWQGASFRLLGDDGFTEIYQNNQQLFEAKWGSDAMAGAY